jgi:hypothetical protein
MRFIKTIFFLLFVAGSGCVHVRDSPHITGVVYDMGTLQPIAGARLYYDRHPKRVIHTFSDGTFDFPPIFKWSPALPIDRPFHQYLIVEAQGYESSERRCDAWHDRTNELFLLKRN